MTTNPNQPDPGMPPAGSDPIIDEGLLDEALAQSSPAELEAKILDLTDPSMLSLLDEALAPEAADQLTQRILAATQSSMQHGTVPLAPPANDAGVLARIGPSTSTFRYAAAAVIALAVALGVLFMNQGPDPIGPEVANVIETPGASAGDETMDDASDSDWLTDEQYASSDAFFDGATSPIETSLQGVADSLDDVTISRDTIWSELDAYEQFLSDIES